MSAHHVRHLIGPCAELDEHLCNRIGTNQNSLLPTFVIVVTDIGCGGLDTATCAFRLNMKYAYIYPD